MKASASELGWPFSPSVPSRVDGPFRPFLSAKANGIPCASCSAAMSSNVLPSAAAEALILRVRNSHTMCEPKMPSSRRQLPDPSPVSVADPLFFGFGFPASVGAVCLPEGVENAAQDVKGVLRR